MAKTIGLVFEGDKKIAFKNGKKVEIVENNVENNVDNTTNAPKELSYAELKEKANALGLEFNGNIKKDDLKALIEDAEKAKTTPEGPEGINPDPEGDE